jgi:DNA-binding NtrC family response regulator
MAIGVIPLLEHEPDVIVGHSAAMDEVRRRIRSASPVRTTVLIEGPTGSGKELVARAIHEGGYRSRRRFIAVNCGGKTETLLESELFGHARGAFTGATADHKGLFEQAHGGTLFLDEIGEASAALQVDLLRVVEDRQIRRVGDERTIPVDVRLIAATNRSLEEEVRLGRFREDLVYRLNAYRIPVPQLAARRDDIALLAEFFLEKHARAMDRSSPQISAAAMAVLETREYDGNVRELSNLIEHALLETADGETILPGHLFEGDRSLSARPPTLSAAVARFERGTIADALERNDWKRDDTAKELGISTRWLIIKMKRHGLKRPD